MHFLRYILFLFIIFISLFAPYKAYTSHILFYQEKIIDVNKGENIIDVVSKFSHINLINRLYLKLFININQINSINFGEYDISKKSLSEIIFDMKSGNTVTHIIQINEGMTIYDVENLISESYLINDCSFLKCINSEFQFEEGILFPDTYFYKKGMKASKILKKSSLRMSDFLNKNAKNTNLSKKDILIISSIIEKEAGNNKEKIDIAAVFLKRLSIGMRLQADPTIIYGLLPDFDGDIKKTDILNKNNKYNTYMISGLPPTPIAISSPSSIMATINAEPGEYLFFVADSPTSHYFSRSYEEHVNKISELGLN